MCWTQTACYSSTISLRVRVPFRAIRVRVAIVALRVQHFFLSADARIGNASNRQKGLTQVVRETRIYQGISEPARNVTGFLTDLLRMCQV